MVWGDNRCEHHGAETHTCKHQALRSCVKRKCRRIDYHRLPLPHWSLFRLLCLGEQHFRQLHLLRSCAMHPEDRRNLYPGRFHPGERGKLGATALDLRIHATHWSHNGKHDICKPLRRKDDLQRSIPEKSPSSLYQLHTVGNGRHWKLGISVLG